MTHYWMHKSDTPANGYYTVGCGDDDIVFIKGKGPRKAEQMALVIARALNAHEAEMHRLANKDDE